MGLWTEPLLADRRRRTLARRPPSPIAMAAADLPVEKITISGPILASIIQRFASSPGDVDGLLFGHITPLPPPDLRDDEPTATAPIPAASAAVTAHFCSGSPLSFYDPLGRIDRRALRRYAARCGDPGGPVLLGWFSGRRCTPLRPSMREHAVSVSLRKTLTLDRERPPAPCVFLLLSSSETPNNALHTHAYRAFALAASGSLEPRSLDVINVGPAFRGHYSSFTPESSAFPLVPCGLMGIEGEGVDQNDERHSLVSMREQAREQQMLDLSAEGFELERLKQLAGPGAAEYTSGLEDLYEKMLLKTKKLARLVEMSSARVREQENRNVMLRSKLAGLE